MEGADTTTLTPFYKRIECMSKAEIDEDRERSKAARRKRDLTLLEQYREKGGELGKKSYVYKGVVQEEGPTQQGKDPVIPANHPLKTSFKADPEVSKYETGDVVGNEDDLRNMRRIVDKTFDDVTEVKVGMKRPSKLDEEYKMMGTWKEGVTAKRVMDVMPFEPLLTNRL